MEQEYGPQNGRTSVDIELVILGLEEPSDKSEQERLWARIKNDGTEMSSFTEAICCMFDSTGLGDLLNKDTPIDRIPRQQASNLRRLRKLAGSISEDLSPIEQIEHPVMREIRQVAAETLRALRPH